MWYHLLKMVVSYLFYALNRLTGNRMPPLGSACAIVEQDGRFLLIEQPHRHFVFPGGFMHWDELPAQAAEREAYEETGLHLRAGELLNVYPTTSKHPLQMSNICFVYIASVLGGELRTNPEGRPLWLTEAEVRQRMTRGDQRLLDDYLQHVRDQADRPH